MRFSLPTLNLPEYCADPNEKDIFFYDTCIETCVKTSSKKEESPSIASALVDSEEDLRVLVPTKWYRKQKGKNVLRETERAISQAIKEESQPSRQEYSEEVEW
ncbi:uncharacterized protein LOC123318350 [Coccinella septempunctata]|uniref:uncharacterized protein LOC123318350 n=1 Tax=Coccinella septempunctata TaxID=41139 RepID=UPI001D075938|nr:uncharacterized protein LOC123318350 [Coccinella septempunctata]